MLSSSASSSRDDANSELFATSSVTRQLHRYDWPSLRSACGGICVALLQHRSICNKCDNQPVPHHVSQPPARL
jgi:hypothetical protein